MRIGCATTDEQSVYLLKEIGYDYLEFSGKKLVAMTPEEFFDFRHHLEVSGLPCECLTAYCSPSVVIAGENYVAGAGADYAQKVAERASLIGVKNVSIGSPFSRRLPDDFPRQKAMEQACSFLKETAEVFARYQITVCFEALGACYCNFINTTDEVAQLLQLVQNKQVGMVVDFYNLEHGGEADMDLSPYRDLILHAHISDDDNDPYKRDFLRADKQEIHQKRVARLYQAGYQQRISVEIDQPVTREKASYSFTVLNEVRTMLRAE